jgi:hypothetical protein
LLLANCASNTPAPLSDYQPESFDASNAYAHHYAAPPGRTCEAARRVLLSQGYVVDPAKPGQSDQVAGRKYFQPDPNHHVQLEFRVVCAAQGQNAGGGTTVFASGLQDQYSLRKTKESASLGVGLLGSLSVPVEGGTDAMVKVASETVTDADMYQRFFDLIDGLLESGEVPKNLPSPAAAPASAAAPAPAPSAALPAASDDRVNAIPAPASAASAASPAASDDSASAIPAPTPTASTALPAASAAAP